MRRAAEAVTVTEAAKPKTTGGLSTAGRMAAVIGIQSTGPLAERKAEAHHPRKKTKAHRHGRNTEALHRGVNRQQSIIDCAVIVLAR